MTRSAATSIPFSDAIDALLVMAHPDCWAGFAQMREWN
jgi:hypothetical protein